MKSADYYEEVCIYIFPVFSFIFHDHCSPVIIGLSAFALPVAIDGPWR